MLAHNTDALMVIMKETPNDDVGLIVDLDDAVGREMMASLVGWERMEEHSASVAPTLRPF